MSLEPEESPILRYDLGEGFDALPPRAQDWLIDFIDYFFNRPMVIVKKAREWNVKVIPVLRRPPRPRSKGGRQLDLKILLMKGRREFLGECPTYRGKACTPTTCPVPVHQCPRARDIAHLLNDRPARGTPER